MKKNYILPILGLATIGFVSMQRNETINVTTMHGKNTTLFSGGADAGKTGAPGEQSCAQCHGSSQSGATENLFTLLDGTTPTTGYVPGQTYSAGLTMASNPSVKGFEVTALDGNNNMAGTFTAISLAGTQKKTGPTREYITHTGSTNAPSGWGWTWNAPATDVGNVTFYIATNKANGNNNATGDVIYLSQHVIGSSASVVELSESKFNFEAGYASNGNQLIIDFNTEEAGDMAINIVDLSGKSVFNEVLGTSLIGENHQKVALGKTLNDGIYIVNFFINNNAMSTKIMVKN